MSSQLACSILVLVFAAGLLAGKPHLDKRLLAPPSAAASAVKIVTANATSSSRLHRIPVAETFVW